MAERWKAAEKEVLYRQHLGYTMGKQIQKLYHGLPKHMDTLLVQIRIGKIDLKAYLH
jgi:hypothetical protein